MGDDCSNASMRTEPEDTPHPWVIHKLYAFVAVHEDGDEGLVAFQDPDSGNWMPMIAADKKRLDSLCKMAKKIAKIRKIDIRVLEFSTRVELERLTP